MRGRHPRRFALGVRATLALLALLPFAGLGWFSVRALQSAAERVDTAAQIVVGAPQVTRLAKLSSSISTEAYWATAVSAATSLGVPPEFIDDIIGLDIVGEFDEIRASVDVQIEDLGLQQLEELLVNARSVASSNDVDSIAIDQGYGVVIEALEGPISSQLLALSTLAADVPDSLMMTRTADALAISVQLREDASGVASGYFAVRYPSAAAEENPAAALLRWTALYDYDAQRLDKLMDPDSVLRTQWEAVTAQRVVAEMFDRADQSSTAFVSNAVDVSSSGRVNLATIDVDAEARAFAESVTAVDLHFDFIDAAGDELARIAGEVGDDASASQRSVILATIAIGSLSLLAVILASWWIVRPLRRMAEAVESMREGELGGHVAIAGPHELRTAGRALNEAADHLKLAEHQAAVLADADLDHPILRETPPGKLGSSLQDAVRRLATSLAEREELRGQLEYEATHDYLTGLANRSAAMDSLTRSLARVRRSEQDLALLFIDIDEFKRVNDRFGHIVGDIVLRTIADRVREASREGDLVGRIGGDEFLVIAEPVRDVHEAIVLGQRVLESVSEPIEIEGNQIEPSVSIGVSLAGGNDLSADELLRDADLAVYRAKDQGRSRVEICDVELRAELTERMEIEVALRRAITEDELVVHYQSVVDAAHGQLVSLEALVRWDRPGMGRVMPDAFIPVAERSRLIISLDTWVLRTVVAQLADWRDHPVLGGVSVAVNVSGRHLSLESFADDVLATLDHEDIHPSRLTLEITESALLHDLERSRVQLDVLRGQGVRVALDDFGTGYTSLAHLRHLPVDVLKIDQSFVSNLDSPEDRSLVKMIVETGHLLGASVTAEGVETDQQAATLVKMGSDYLQGFLYSHPVTPAELAARLETSADLRA